MKTRRTQLMFVYFVLILYYCFTQIDAKKALIDNEVNGIIAAFGDLDSDKLTDIFIISKDGRTLSVAKGFTDEPLMRPWLTVRCNFSTGNDVIVNVIPGDFHGDALMDALVVTQDKDTNFRKSKKPEFKLWLLRGTGGQLQCNSNTTALAERVVSQPTVLDFDGDFIADFIVESLDCTRELWMFKKKTGSWSRDCPSKLQSDESMLFPHSNAFISIFNTSHMSPDVIITGNKSIEYCINDNGISCKNPIKIQYPDGYKYIGQSAFVDINFNGNIEHFMPACRGDIDTCNSPQILLYHKNKWINILDLKNGKNASSQLTFTMVQFNNYLDFPVTLRHGDIDGDGFVDLITVMHDSDGRNKAVVLKNVKTSDNEFGRKFVVDWTSDNILPSTLKVDLAAFFDLYEDGKVDILINSRDENDNIRIDAFVNTQLVAACFLKVLVTSGLCYGNCPLGNIPYGTNQAGPFIRYKLADTDGQMQTGCAGQLSQSAHFALQMPYSVFGLGETPNFVESVYASIPSGTNNIRKGEFTQIVPDAQVVLIPFPSDDPDNWISKLFVTPSNIVFSTLITLASICCVLVLIIGILHRKELLEDLAEHEEYKRHWPESR